MPWRQVYEPAPQDMSLPVLSNLPEGVTERKFSFGYREASGEPSESGWPQYHFCRHCNGWIEGYPNQYSVNTLNTHMLAGRRGTEYHCRRCSEQIGFMGMVS